MDEWHCLSSHKLNRSDEDTKKRLLKVKLGSNENLSSVRLTILYFILFYFYYTSPHTLSCFQQTPAVSEFTLSYSPSSAFLCVPKTEPDLFGFQESEDPYPFSPSQFTEPNHLYTLEDGFYSEEFIDDTQMLDQCIVKLEDCSGTDEFVSQDLSGVGNLDKPPVVISENDNCCVVQLESSSIDNNPKQYFSL